MEKNYVNQYYARGLPAAAPKELSWKIPAGTQPGRLEEKFVSYTTLETVSSLHSIYADNPTNSAVSLVLTKYFTDSAGVEHKCSEIAGPNTLEVNANTGAEDAFSYLFNSAYSDRPAKLSIRPVLSEQITADATLFVLIKEM